VAQPSRLSLTSREHAAARPVLVAAAWQPGAVASSRRRRTITGARLMVQDYDAGGMFRPLGARTGTGNAVRWDDGTRGGDGRAVHPGCLPGPQPVRRVDDGVLDRVVPLPARHERRRAPVRAAHAGAGHGADGRLLRQRRPRGGLGGRRGDGVVRRRLRCRRLRHAARPFRTRASAVVGADRADWPSACGRRAEPDAARSHPRRRRQTTTPLPLPHHRPDSDALPALAAGTNGRLTLLLGDDQ
jgi:hypothetical protein